MGYFLDSILLICLRFVTFDKPSSNNKTIIFMMYLHFPISCCGQSLISDLKLIDNVRVVIIAIQSMLMFTLRR